MKKLVKSFLAELRRVDESELIGLHRPRSLARVGSITTFNQIARAVLALLTAVILSRLLPPEVFGLLAMVMFFQTLFSTLSGAGFVEAVIQTKEIKRSQLSSLYWLNAMLGGILGGAMFTLAVPIADFYDESQLVQIARSIGIIFFVNNLCLIHRALLKRNMRVELYVLTDLIPAALQLPLSVFFALYGFGVWSIVLASGAGALLRQLMVIYFIEWRPGRPGHFDEIKPMFQFGLRSTAGGLVSYLSQNLQTLVLGKFAAPAEVGFYNRAQSIFQKPIRQFARPLAGVLLPSMSAIQDEREKLMGMVNRATWFLGLCLLPFTVIMIAFGDWITVLLLGKNWEVAGKVMQWVALAQFPQTVTAPLTRANSAIGRPARALWIQIAEAIAIIFIITLIAKQGAILVAMYMAGLRIVFYSPQIVMYLLGFGVPWQRYAYPTLRLLGFSACVVVVLLSLRVTLPEESAMWANFGMVGLLLPLIYISYIGFYYFSDPGRGVLKWILQRGPVKRYVPKWLSLAI